MTELAVTDTHALIWHATGRPARLGRRARDLFERADAGDGAIYVPTFVLVELFEAVRRGVLRVGEGAAAWVEDLTRSGSYFVADLTVDVALRAHALYAIPERGDRLIAATAAALDLPLITRDPAIARAAAVRRVW